jgi:very-short-patch-repair endonuclease
MDLAALMRPRSQIEEILALHIRAEKLPQPVREYLFDPGRKWRFDFAWPAIHFAVEVDGEVHRISERFHSDMRKNAMALLQGWDVLHVGGREIKSGEAIQWVRALLWERVGL